MSSVGNIVEEHNRTVITIFPTRIKEIRRTVGAGTLMVIATVLFAIWSQPSRSTSFRGDLQCGHYCIQRCALLLGVPTTLDEVYNLLPERPYDSGHSLRELQLALRDLGIESEGWSVEYRELQELPVPFIAHYAERHFVLVEAVSHDRVRISDNERQGITTSMTEFVKKFSGRVLLPSLARAEEETHDDMARTSTARIQFEYLYHDMGDVSSETGEIHALFPFTNSGSGVLTLLSAEVGCSCATVSVGLKDYQPGEIGVVELVFEPAAFTGPFSQEAYIMSNDPENPVIKLAVVVGGGLYPLEITPTVLSFGGAPSE